MSLQDFKKDNKFLMLALDHRGSFKKFINTTHPEKVSDAEVIANKKIIIESLENYFSGVLLDPVWGLPAYPQKHKPYLLCLEKTGYSDEGGERITEIEYSVKELKAVGASGVKLLIYFNPEAKNKDKQLATSKKILEEAKANDMPLFLEIITYGNEELNKTRKEWVLRSLALFLDYDIKPEVFKLEYPDDQDGCEQITKILNNIPWILLTRGVSFAVFKNQLSTAITAGAQGFLAGRALWQEIVDYQTIEQKQEFLVKVVAKRFAEINKITLK
jgi:tagatose 1,6-diphosphate aldolase